jgi:hypothetical protein
VVRRAKGASVHAFSRDLAGGAGLARTPAMPALITLTCSLVTVAMVLGSVLVPRR